MNTVEAVASGIAEVTYIINGRSFSGVTGTLYGRVAIPTGDVLAPLERLALRLNISPNNYKVLYRQFLRREAFPFEIHQGSVVRLTTRAVISELVRNADCIACLVEFNLIAIGGGGTTRRLLGGGTTVKRAFIP